MIVKEDLGSKEDALEKQNFRQSVRQIGRALSYVDERKAERRTYNAACDPLFAHKPGFDHHLVKPADIRKVQQILATVSPASVG